MWRSRKERVSSARRRLGMARGLWGWSPHPAQERFFSASAQVRVAACGRRWGKTECLAVDLATLALECVAEGIPSRQLVAAPTEAQALLIGSECRRLLEAASRAPHLDKEWSLATRKNPGLDLTIGDSHLLFRTGGRDGRALRGLSAHRIVVDEAAYAPDELVYEALLPMLADAGGELTLASSPAGRRGAFYRFFAHAENASEGDELLLPHAAAGGGALTFFSQQCPSTDNPHLDRDWLAAMMEEAGERRYAQEFLAQFLEDGDAVFREEDIAACIEADPRVFWEGDDLLSRPDPERLYALGVDWGRKVDFTAAALIDGSERPARLVGLWRRRGMGWDAQRRWLADLAARYQPVRILCDSTSVGDPATEALRAAIWERRDSGVGGRCPDPEPFCFTPSSKTALIDRLGIALSARALRFPRHPVLLSELQAFEYGAPGPTGRRPMAAAGSGHDDTVCALALAWRATPTGAGLYSGAGVHVGSSL